MIIDCVMHNTLIASCHQNGSPIWALYIFALEIFFQLIRRDQFVIEGHQPPVRANQINHAGMVHAVTAADQRRFPQSIPYLHKQGLGLN
jgi:hypothetical protein